MTDIPNLHDATFVGLACSWEEARVVIRLVCVRPSPDIELVASGLMTLSLSHREPWGPSVFVYKASLSAAVETSGGRALRLEMQSGDEILIVAQEVTVQPWQT